ncbi:hypothetical protein K491DRAFT_601139 [Lophiostoma macrostomum CBS 122681]|uniref:Uncharacterized protein n=1 Tax=Lophiostoma macrostomum CBS 122681 TaxID=1314788 RepID=A0A6A6T347_9PLEO|nr:hypothetical protein K491DRAFT_601139 [Lophiostoma macrostomum CBS 122681]
MCHGASDRVSQGGSIAVLKPISSTTVDQTCVSDECRLIFSNRLDTVSQWHTQVEFQGWERRQGLRDGDTWAIIHKDGDLTVPNSGLHPNQLPSQPFYSFTLNGPDSTMKLPQQLELGVGESGIIGRRISIMNGSPEGVRILAQGVLGWN